MTTTCAPLIYCGRLARYCTYSCNVLTLGSSGTHRAEVTSDHMSVRLLLSYSFTVKLTWSPVVVWGALRGCTIAIVRHKGNSYPVATHFEYRGDEGIINPPDFSIP